MMTGDMDQAHATYKSNSRLEKSLKNHVKQYKPSIFKQDDEYVSRDQNLISNSNYHSQTHTNVAGVYQDKRKDRASSKNRRCINTATGYRRDYMKPNTKDIRIHTSNGARSRPQFNNINSEILIDKRCKTAVHNKRERVKSDVLLKQNDPSLNIVSEYNPDQETVG
jgi:hypothetical protein